MKRILCLSVIAVMLMSLVPITAGAETSFDNQYENLYYTKYDDHIEITYCDEGAVSVDIPAEIDGLPVTTIGDYAFEYCDSLTSVTIPNGVTRIGDLAFYDCDSLTGITIPDSVKSIGNNAFSSCGKLASVTIPSSVTHIGYEALEGCSSLTSINVNPKNNCYCSVDGNLFDKKKETLIQYAVGKTDSEYTIPDSVTNIGNTAFYLCRSLTSISIPAGVTSIGDSAFAYCESLMSMNIPVGVTSIGRSAFARCYSLAGITIPESVMSIGYGAFMDCRSLTSVTIPNSVTSIGDSAFKWCESLTSVTMPSNITSIGSEAFEGTAYYNDESNWDNDVLYIGNCLINARGISGDYIIKNGTKVIADSAFITYVESKLTNVTIPNSVTSIGSEAFWGCDSLMSVSIPDSVKSIGTYAFSNNDNLSIIDIADSVKIIGAGAFEGTAYYNDESNWDNNVLYIGNYLIEAKEGIGGEYAIRSGTKVIAENAFYECDSLTSISIPSSLTSIGKNAFVNCYRLENVYISDLAAYLNINFGLDSSSIQHGYNLYLNNKLIEGELSIPNGIKQIPDFAFWGCDGITSVSIPDSVTSIGKMAFYVCDGLTSVSIPNSVTSIGDDAFYGCNSLTSISISDSVTSIGNAAFACCYSLTSINVNPKNNYYCSVDGSLFDKNKETLVQYAVGKSDSNYTVPDGVTSIGNYAFAFCLSLTSVSIPDGVTRIGDSAFEYCYRLTNASIPSSITSIGDSAFAYCSSLTSITIPGNVTSIGDYAFGDCERLTDVYYGGGEAQWRLIDIKQNNENLLNAKIHYNSTPTEPEEINFSYKIDYDGTVTITGCDENVSGAITIPDKINDLPVTSIASGAFDGCASLTSVTISDGVVVLGWRAFGGCTSLTDINIPDSVAVIGLGAFSDTGYYNDETNWNNGVLYIDNHLIEARDGISGNYTIKSGTRTIAESAFSGCGALKKITIPDGVVNIDDYAFRDCTSLTDVTIPDGVTEIRMGAFYGCSSLASVTIPESIMYVDEAAFRNCSSLTDVYYGGSEADWMNVERLGADDLFNTTIHYGKLGPLEVKPVEPIIDEAAGTVEIPVTVTEPERAAELNEIELYIAEYDEDGRFIGVTLGEKSAVKDDTIIAKGTIPKTNNYKIMLWDVNQAPLMSAIEGGAKSDENTSDDSSLTYNIDNNEVTITGCADGVADIVIPSKIDGLPVTEIANEAFYENHSLKSVYIEEGVNWIGLNAFYGCDNLLSIHIPDTLETVLDMAFGDCKKLTDITINENSDSYVIKDGVLFDKDMMRLVLAPRNISGSYTVPDGVLVIGTSAFDSCYNLKEINFAGGIKVIEQMAFGDCTGLTSLKIPFEKGITFRDYFHGDSREDTEAKACEIGQSAFYGCSNIKSVVIYTVPNRRYTIDERGYLYIDYRAFFDCSALEKIYLPCDTRSIDEQAFNYCDALRDVYFEGTEEDDITVNENNKGFFNSTMHYNFAAPLL